MSAHPFGACRSDREPDLCSNCKITELTQQLAEATASLDRIKKAAFPGDQDFRSFSDAFVVSEIERLRVLMNDATERWKQMENSRDRLQKELDDATR